MTATIVVNRAFGGQRVTGQQRYATEISTRLLGRSRVRALDVPRRLASSAAAAWGWAQTLEGRVGRTEFLLSLTSRAPFVHRRHVFVVHDLFVLTHPEWFAPSYVATHAPALRLQLRTAHALIAVSEPVADQVRDHVRGRVPVTVATNAGDSAALVRGPVRSPAPAPGMPGIEPGSYFLAVGSRDPRKNLRTLAEAYGNLPAPVRRAHPLVVVGGTGKSFGDHHVEWPTGTAVTGYVPDDRLSTLYANALAVALPSLDEGFGLPVLEAASARVPVVMSDIPVFRWVYGDDGVYVDPTRPDELTAALEEAVRGHVPPPARLEAKARALARRFTWQRSADEVYRFVRGLGA